MLGKILLTIDALGLLFGAPLADYNHTHMFNPRWPPHAKFHNAQTISLSVILGGATLWYAWQSSIMKPKTPVLAAQLKRESLRVAAFTGSIYWLAGLSAILYPGTMGLDPEFGGPGFPQRPIFIGFACLALTGWFLECSREGCILLAREWENRATSPLASRIAAEDR